MKGLLVGCLLVPILLLGFMFAPAIQANDLQADNIVIKDLAPADSSVVQTVTHKETLAYRENYAVTRDYRLGGRILDTKPVNAIRATGEAVAGRARDLIGRTAGRLRRGCG